MERVENLKLGRGRDLPRKGIRRWGKEARRMAFIGNPLTLTPNPFSVIFTIY